MKRFLLGLVCIMSVSAYATTLRIPIFVEGVPAAGKGKKQKKVERDIPVRWLNSKIKKAGLEPIPEFVEVESVKDIDQFDVISAQIDAAAEKLGPAYKNMSLKSESPGGNHAGDIGTCYTGRADGVVKIIFDLAGTYYTEQLGLWGWKYKTKTVWNSDLEDSDKQLVNSESKLWRNWRGDDDAVLFVYHEGDDGTDIQASIFDRCDD